MANQRKEHDVKKYIQWVTTLSLTIPVYLYSFSSCCLSNLQNHAKFCENSNIGYSSSRSSKVIDLSFIRKRICKFLLGLLIK